MIPILVLKIVGAIRLAHKAFEVFDHPNLDLTWFVVQRIFQKCHQVLVSLPHGIEPRLS
jgi:hypothetical protein